MKAKKCGRNAGEIRDIGLKMQGGERMSLTKEHGAQEVSLKNACLGE